MKALRLLVLVSTIVVLTACDLPTTIQSYEPPEVPGPVMPTPGAPVGVWVPETEVPDDLAWHSVTVSHEVYQVSSLVCEIYITSSGRTVEVNWSRSGFFAHQFIEYLPSDNATEFRHVYQEWTVHKKADLSEGDIVKMGFYDIGFIYFRLLEGGTWEVGVP